LGNEQRGTASLSHNVRALTSARISRLFTVQNAQSAWGGAVADTQGLNDRDIARQHVLCNPRFTDQPLGLVPSLTGVQGGASRRLVEGNATINEGVLPEIARKQGIAFFAHPLANSGGGKGPGMLPYTDYQYEKVFGEPAFVGLQLWNEDRRVSSAGCFCYDVFNCACPAKGDYEVTGYSWMELFNDDSHMPGWTARAYHYTPMYDLEHWGWQRLRFNLDEQLHNGAYTWGSTSALGARCRANAPHSLVTCRGSRGGCSWREAPTPMVTSIIAARPIEQVGVLVVRKTCSPSRLP
jgi:hypothetical protein